jgi:hypothetical protein
VASAVPGDPGKGLVVEYLPEIDWNLRSGGVHIDKRSLGSAGGAGRDVGEREVQVYLRGWGGGGTKDLVLRVRGRVDEESVDGKKG